MAKLDSLIRVRKHTVEQQQKALAELYRKAEALKEKRDALETELAIESEKSRELQPDMLEYFSAYVKQAHKTIDTIDRNRERLENQIKLAQEQLREAFAELKKIEIINKRRKDAVRAKEEKEESKELDEVGIEGFRRKQ
jgi:flagellar export protein FliJ